MNTLEGCFQLFFRSEEFMLNFNFLIRLKMREDFTMLLSGRVKGINRI